MKLIHGIRNFHTCKVFAVYSHQTNLWIGKHLWAYIEQLIQNIYTYIQMFKNWKTKVRNKTPYVVFTFIFDFVSFFPPIFRFMIAISYTTVLLKVHAATGC